MGRPLTSPVATPERRFSLFVLLARGYDWIAAPHRRHAAEQAMVQIAAWGLLLHLSLIALAWFVGGPLEDLVGRNWLAALYTPFAAILIFEVLLLVLAIPESTTRAMALQFQIISLIVIRNGFKDLAGLDHLGRLLEDPEAQIRLGLDIVGGVVLFGLVSVFYWVAGWPSAHQQALRTPSPVLARFIERKKAIAFVLSLVFAALLGSTLIQWVRDGWAVLSGVATTRPSLSPTTPFFQTLFAIMIVADILILVLSLQLSDAYQQVFRGASFVLATILLRVALSAERPLQVGIAILAVLFSIAILAIYKKWARDPWQMPPETDEGAAPHG